MVSVRQFLAKTKTGHGTKDDDDDDDENGKLKLKNDIWGYSKISYPKYLSFIIVITKAK